MMPIPWYTTGEVTIDLFNVRIEFHFSLQIVKCMSRHTQRVLEVHTSGEDTFL